MVKASWPGRGFVAESIFAVEGEIVLSRAEHDPAPLLDATRELEAAIGAALD
jgi:hypothetical protein